MLSTKHVNDLHTAFKSSTQNESAPIKKDFASSTSGKWFVQAIHHKGIVIWYENVGNDLVKFYDDLPQ